MKGELGRPILPTLTFGENCCLPFVALFLWL
jgi:hypothetical protein